MTPGEIQKQQPGGCRTGFEANLRVTADEGDIGRIDFPISRWQTFPMATRMKIVRKHERVCALREDPPAYHANGGASRHGWTAAKSEHQQSH